jgi:hypothetical protein
MTTTHHPTRTRDTIIIDVHHQPLLTVPIWARQSAHPHQPSSATTASSPTLPA